MAMILDGLHGQDAISFVRALTGQDVTPFCLEDVESVPQLLRPKWFFEEFILSFDHFLREDVAVPALYHARVTYGSILAFADWTPFSPSIKDPVAEYTWMEESLPHVWVNHSMMKETLLDSVLCERPVTRISLHVLCPMNSIQTMLHWSPLKILTFQMTPPFFVSPTVDVERRCQTRSGRCTARFANRW